MKSQTGNTLNNFYQAMEKAVAEARKRFQRPLTLTEKILVAHLFDKGQLASWSALPVRGKTQVALLPDRVAMQDATAQMAMLQYMQAGLGQVAVPTSIHCDHLIRAKAGASGVKSCPFPSPPAINTTRRDIPFNAATVAPTLVPFESS